MSLYIASISAAGRERKGWRDATKGQLSGRAECGNETDDAVCRPRKLKVQSFASFQLLWLTREDHSVHTLTD